jgi:hypothetical protein
MSRHCGFARDLSSIFYGQGHRLRSSCGATKNNAPLSAENSLLGQRDVKVTRFTIVRDPSFSICEPLGELRLALAEAWPGFN